MRFVVLGAGAVGGVVGGRLHQAGHDVTLLARGRHLDLIRRHGLRLESPSGSAVLPVRARSGPEQVGWRGDEVVLLCVKSHQTQTALEDLAAHAPRTVAVACLQNGIANEPSALRHFANVYAVTVMLPGSFLEPGVVRAWSTPLTGLLDVGRFPSGVDELADAISAAFRSATFDSRSVTDPSRGKLRKLLTNLGNAVQAVCGPGAAGGRLVRLVAEEGEAALSAAGLTPATPEEDRARRADLLQIGQIGGERRGGGSSWQSLQRGTGDIETDYLNGEIVLLGRLHGIPTPANALLQVLARDLAAARRPPGALSESDVLGLLDESH